MQDIVFKVVPNLFEGMNSQSTKSYLKLMIY